MAKSVCSIASPASCASSALSPTSSTSSSASTYSSSSLSSSRGSKSDKSTNSKSSLNIKSTSSIDRRKRLAANARERKRMHLLNKAYDGLRRRLVDAENKSKYDVLVQAKEYIQALATICEKFDRDQESAQQQVTTTTSTTTTTSNAPSQQQAKAPNNVAQQTSPALIQQSHHLKQLSQPQAKPVDLTYNQIQLIQQHQHFHHLNNNHLDCVQAFNPKPSIQLYKHQQHSSLPGMTFT